MPGGTVQIHFLRNEFYGTGRMAVDSCNPRSPLSLNTMRFWSILFPILGLILTGEFIFVFMSVPDVMDTALTITGKLPQIPSNIGLGASKN
jgi:hypothetical protein